jgi:hypothetical protein
MSRDRIDPRYDPMQQLIEVLHQLKGALGRPGVANAAYVGPAAGDLYRAADPLSRDNNDLPGFPFTYSPGMAVLLNGVGTPTAPGTLTTIQYTVTDATHDVFFKLAVSTGPFLVQIRVGDRYTSQVAGNGVNAVRSELVFGNSAASPGLWLRSLHTKTNDIVYFDLYDVSGAPNYVSIAMDGIVRGR